MNCPNCDYTPVINENDYAEGEGRFFELGIEAKQESNPDWRRGLDYVREPVFGCPRCGVMFMNMGFKNDA